MSSTGASAKSKGKGKGKAKAAAAAAAVSAAAAAAEEGAHSQGKVASESSVVDASVLGRAATPAPQAPETTEVTEEPNDTQQEQLIETFVVEDTSVDARGDESCYDVKTDEEEGGDERPSFLPEGSTWDPSSFEGMSWIETSEGGHLPPFAPTATDNEKRAHFLQTYRSWCLTRHSTVFSDGWPICIMAKNLGDWCLAEERHLSCVDEVSPLMKVHHDNSDDSCEFFDPNTHEYQLQHLAMLGLKQITIAAFEQGRRNQEPRAILSNGLLRSHDGQEDFHWSNSLVQYQYDENDASRSEVGIVLLATNAKSVMEFVTAGGHGAMLGQDGQPRTYNRTKEKMLSALEKWQYMPFFVRPHADKLLFATLAGFPFSE